MHYECFCHMANFRKIEVAEVGAVSHAEWPNGTKVIRLGSLLTEANSPRRFLLRNALAGNRQMERPVYSTVEQRQS